MEGARAHAFKARRGRGRSGWRQIYVIGGASFHPGSSETVMAPGRPHRSVPTVEEYDPSTNAWRARSPMPTARVLCGGGLGRRQNLRDWRATRYRLHAEYE